jgi:hypothetical protein
MKILWVPLIIIVIHTILAIIEIVLLLWLEKTAASERTKNVLDKNSFHK